MTHEEALAQGLAHAFLDRDLADEVGQSVARAL